MKIILFTDNLGAGGAQRQLVGLAEMLHQQGYEVKVCTYQDSDFYKPFLTERNIPNEVIPGASEKYKRIALVANYFKKENPDYIIAYQEVPSLIACLSRLLGCSSSVIVSERNTTQVITLKDRFRFCLYRLAVSIVPNSYSQEQFLLSRYKWMKSKMTTITNFVDLDRFSFSTKTKKDIPIVVVAATIWPPKNIVGLIEAIKILVDRGRLFKVQCYGIVSRYENYVNECLNLIKTYSLEDYIELLPKTQEIHNKYRECDIFCLPSFYEGTPNVICEAMAVGRPVLCSDICDNSRYIQDGINGFLFNPNSPDNIADVFEKALNLSDEQYKNMCYNNRRKAEEMLSKDVFVNKYINLLNKQ